MLCDTDRSIGLAYEACDSRNAEYAKRITYVIDPEGKITRAYDDVGPKGHADEILRDLKAKS